MRKILALIVLVVLPACGGSSSPNAPTPIPVAPPPTTLPRPIWTLSGSGNTVFDMPTTVSRVRIQGTWQRTGNSNFIVWVGGRLVVNEILRDTIVYDGTHLVSGGVTETRNSNNIVWAFTEIR